MKVFGRVDVEIKKMENRIVGLEQLLLNDYSSQIEKKLLNCTQKY